MRAGKDGEGETGLGKRRKKRELGGERGREGVVREEHVQIASFGLLESDFLLPLTTMMEMLMEMVLMMLMVIMIIIAFEKQMIVKILSMMMIEAHETISPPLLLQARQAECTFHPKTNEMSTKQLIRRSLQLLKEEGEPPLW